MADSINREILTGNLGRSPEVKTFDSGKRKVNLRIGVYCGGKGDDKRTQWRDVVLWSRDGTDLAFDAVCLLESGDRVIVDGSPDVERWTGRDGEAKEKHITKAWAILLSPRARQRAREQRDDGPPMDDGDPGPEW